MIYYLQAEVQPSVEFGQLESKDSSNLQRPSEKRGWRASAVFMDVTLVTEDDPIKLQNKCLKVRKRQRILVRWIRAKPRRRQAMSRQKQQKMIEDPRIRLIDKDGIKVS